MQSAASLLPRLSIIWLVALLVTDDEYFGSKMAAGSLLPFSWKRKVAFSFYLVRNSSIFTATVMKLELRTRCQQ